MLSLLIISSCRPEEENFFELNEYEQKLVNVVSENATTLGSSPLNWNDNNWFIKLSNDIDHLSIGSSFNGNPSDFYYEISDTNYDHMI